MKIEKGKKYRKCGFQKFVVTILDVGKDYVVYSGSPANTVSAYPIVQFEKEFKPINRIEELEPYTAYLDVYGGWLCVLVKGEEHPMGFINEEGRCHIQSCPYHHEATEQWIEHGCKIDHTPVEWRGGKYRLNDCFLERYDTDWGHIWHLKQKGAVGGCTDENIVRYPDDLRAKIF